MKKIINDELIRLILLHSCRLSNLIQGVNFLNRCIEDDGYVESNSELCCLASIINEYCVNTKQNFDIIANKLDID